MMRYFFVTDRLASKAVSIEYCPTQQMLADFVTEPLQGSLFQTFRDDAIMNTNPPREPSQHYRRSVLKNNEAAGRADHNDWTVVQSKSTINKMSRARSIVNASTEGRQHSEMVPTEANKQVNASRTYAEVALLRGKRARRNDAFAIAGSWECSYQHRNCRDCHHSGSHARLHSLIVS